MSETVQTNKNANKGVKVPSRGLVGWKILGPIIKTILTKLNVQFTVEDMEVSETVQGLHLKGGGALSSREWHVCYNGQPAYAKFSSSAAYETSTE